MTDEIRRSVDEIFDALEAIAENGKYREAKEAARVLDSMDYFRNYGYEDIEFRYQELRERFEIQLGTDDLPATWEEEV